MDNAVVGILAGAAAGVVAGIVTQVGAAYRDERRIAADVERRKEEREDRRILAENVALEASRKASVIVNAVATQKEQVLGAIEQNTQVSKDAFYEANGNAAKFAEVHKLVLQLQVDGKKLSDYTHDGIHRINNILTVLTMQQPGEKQPPDDYDPSTPAVDADPHGPGTAGRPRETV